MNPAKALEQWLLIVLVTLCALSLSACSSGGARWLTNDDPAAFQQMVTDLTQARAVFVGEVHDQRQHHNLQLKVIKSLAQKGAPLAIGLEMFDMESQPALDRWVQGDMDLKRFVANYQQNWSISWAEYDSILLYARNHHVPLIALDAPGDIVSKVSHGGFKSLTAADVARLPTGVTTDTSPSYRRFVTEIFAGHMLNEASLNSFCEAQGLRNSTMGNLIRGYLNKNSGSTMVVITGIGHAMRRAVADDLDKQPGLKTLVVIPVVEGLFDQISRDDADYFVYP